jgi:hypothetical protein
MKLIEERLRERAEESGYPKSMLYRGAADEIRRLKGLVRHYAYQAGVSSKELKNVHNI